MISVQPHVLAHSVFYSFSYFVLWVSENDVFRDLLPLESESELYLPLSMTHENQAFLFHLTNQSVCEVYKYMVLHIKVARDT